MDTGIDLLPSKGASQASLIESSNNPYHSSNDTQYATGTPIFVPQGSYSTTYQSSTNDGHFVNSPNSFIQRGGSFSHSGVPLSMASSMMAQHKLTIDEDAPTAYRAAESLYDDSFKYCMRSRDSRSNLDNGLAMTFALLTMMLISVLCNYDHGAVPATLGDIQKDFPMGYVEQSLLGSLVYFGLITGTLLAGVAFQQIEAKWILVSSLVCLSGSLYLFSGAKNMGIMYLTRFFCGLCQAMPIVYLPVWVDEFSPEGSATRWMSYTQLASIGGTVLGYFLGGILSHSSNNINIHFSWRTPFMVQALLIIPAFVALAMVPSESINMQLDKRPTRQRTGFSSAGDDECWSFLKNTCLEVKNLLSNPLYVIIILAMSNLYFVVTGIQFWVTEYMIFVLHHAKLTVVSLSTFCFLTAPTSGVWFGGYVCDLCGGYKGGQQKKACNVATAFAGLAALFACITTQVSNGIIFALFLWGCLFFGAALVPVAVGIVLSCVLPHQRSLSSAVSQFAYNMFGWFSAPLLSGTIMDIIAMQPGIQPETPLRIGFSLILGSSCLGFILFAIANFVGFPDDSKNNEIELHSRTRNPIMSFSG